MICARALRQSPEVLVHVFESNIYTRLQAAYVLRGDYVRVAPNTVVLMRSLPQLSIIHNFTFQESPWGSTADWEQLAFLLGHILPNGIFIMHADHDSAWHVSRGAAWSKASFRSTLEFARYNASSCLALWINQMPTGERQYAAIDVYNGTDCANLHALQYHSNFKWSCLLTAAIRLPCVDTTKCLSPHSVSINDMS